MHTMDWNRARLVRWCIDGAVIGLAILVRVAAIVVLQSQLVPRSTYEHGEIAANLVAGRGFSIAFLGATGPTSQQAPVYPFLVAILYGLFGVETPASLLGVQLGQALLGGLMVLGVMRLARAVGPERPWVAVAAGLIAGLHPTLIYSATHVQVSCLSATLVVWTLVWAYRAGETGRAREAVIVGVLLAILVLTDPILVLVGLGCGWAIWLGARGWRASLRQVTILGVVTAMGIAPWIARNWAVHGEPVFVKSTFGYAFWQGNCRLSHGTDKVVRPSVERVLRQSSDGLKEWNTALWEARHEAGYIDDIALTAAEKASLGRLTEPERSRVLFRRAVDELRAEPGRYAWLCGQRLKAFVLFDETNPKTRSLVYRVGHLGLTLAALAGLLVMSRVMRRRLGPTLLVAVAVTLFHTLTIVSARFHVPIEPLMAVWAAGVLARSETPVGFLTRAPRHTRQRRNQPRRLTVS